MPGIQSAFDATRQSLIYESSFFRVSSPLFSALTRASAADDDIVNLCTATRPGQSAGNLLMCVSHYLLLKSRDSKLGRYYASMTQEPAPAEEAFPAFREFCLDRREEVQDLLSWRTVNTNLVDKATCLLPAILSVSRLTGGPLTLLEICCSSGLNLLFDEYHYDYGAFGRVGPENSPVKLNCKVVGHGRPPVDSIPIITERVGVDLVTVDVSDPLERLWMEAVIAPEWDKERDRLRAALSLRAKRAFRTIEADALEALPALLQELPGSLCILQSYCIGHWSATARRELEELLLETGRHRDIHRLAIEGNEGEPAESARRRLVMLATAGVPILQKSSPSRIDHMWYANGDVRTQLLGEGSIFGTWLDWRQPQA
jgi:hypothetical protein